MLFNSLDFIIFFPLVVGFYYSIKQEYRWVLLLIASYIFYMWWRPEYILLIIFSTIISFYGARFINNSKNLKSRRLILVFSIIMVLVPLFYFKYFAFFHGELIRALRSVGVSIDSFAYSIVLPVGISFYTFQVLSYLIDVYRGNIDIERHLGRYSVYVSFFPQLVAGPIERGYNLIPQFREAIQFDYGRAVKGLRLILYGMFMKIVIADRLGVYVDQVYSNYTEHHGLAVILATFFFSFQIYCDFAGYSMIAIGAANVLGIKLMNNFDYPYFSSTISEFWKRWHISLSTWFRDYLYIPLGGKKVKVTRWYFNILTTFIISGIWHGANWTFIIWGGLHGLYYLVEKVFRLRNKSSYKNVIEEKNSLTLEKFARMFVVFLLVSFSWIFFRAQNVSQAFSMINTISTDTYISRNQGLLAGLPTAEFVTTFTLLLIFIIYEFLKRFRLIPSLNTTNMYVRWCVYYAVIIFIFVFGEFGNHKFIYYQF